MKLELTQKEINALWWAISNFKSRKDCWDYQTWSALKRVAKKIGKNK